MNVVFLCVGAVKSGTSWLCRQLSTHPECHFRTIKELHYFDALDEVRVSRNIDRIRARQVQLLDRTKGGLTALSEKAARIGDGADWLDVLERGRDYADSYLAYLRNGAAAGQVVGEATHAYALLSEERVRKIFRMAEDDHILSLMRDPAARLWSHVRMMAGRRDEDGVVTARRCDRIPGRSVTGAETQIVRRSGFASALDKLKAVVPAGRLLIEVFEEMVQGAGLAHICDFLGIARVTPNPVPVHTGQPLAMSPEQRRRAAQWLAPEYDAAHRALGRTPEAWGREV
jgi:hypothetical protein